MFYFILKKEALFGAGQIAWTERSPALQAGAYDENVWNLPPHPPRLCDIKELLLSARRQIDHWLRSVRYQPALVLWKLRFRALTSAIITRWGLFRCFVIGFSTNIGIPALEFDFMTVSCKPSGRNIWMWDCHVQRCCAVNNVSEIYVLLPCEMYCVSRHPRTGCNKSAFQNWTPVLLQIMESSFALCQGNARPECRVRLNHLLQPTQLPCSLQMDAWYEVPLGVLHAACLKKTS